MSRRSRSSSKNTPAAPSPPTPAPPGGGHGASNLPLYPTHEIVNMAQQWRRAELDDGGSDTALIIAGPPGAGKTTALKTLAGSSANPPSELAASFFGSAVLSPDPAVVVKDHRSIIGLAANPDPPPPPQSSALASVSASVKAWMVARGMKPKDDKPWQDWSGDKWAEWGDSLPEEAPERSDIPDDVAWVILDGIDAWSKNSVESLAKSFLTVPAWLKYLIGIRPHPEYLTFLTTQPEVETTVLTTDIDASASSRPALAPGALYTSSIDGRRRTLSAVHSWLGAQAPWKAPWGIQSPTIYVIRRILKLSDSSFLRAQAALSAPESMETATLDEFSAWIDKACAPAYAAVGMADALPPYVIGALHGAIGGWLPADLWPKDSPEGKALAGPGKMLLRRRRRREILNHDGTVRGSAPVNVLDLPGGDSPNWDRRWATGDDSKDEIALWDNGWGRWALAQVGTNVSIGHTALYNLYEATRSKAKQPELRTPNSVFITPDTSIEEGGTYLTRNAVYHGLYSDDQDTIKTVVYNTLFHWANVNHRMSLVGTHQVSHEMVQASYATLDPVMAGELNSVARVLRLWAYGIDRSVGSTLLDVVLLVTRDCQSPGLVHFRSGISHQVVPVRPVLKVPAGHLEPPADVILMRRLLSTKVSRVEARADQGYIISSDLLVRGAVLMCCKDEDGTPVELKRQMLGHEGGVSMATALDPELGEIVVSCSESSGNLMVWDTQKECLTFQTDIHSGGWKPMPVTYGLVGPYAHWAVIGTASGSIELFNFAKMAIDDTLKDVHKDRIVQMALTPNWAGDGHLVAVLSKKGNLTVHTIGKGKGTTAGLNNYVFTTTKKAPHGTWASPSSGSGNQTCVAWLGQSIAVGGSDGNIRVYSKPKASPVIIKAHDMAVTDISARPMNDAHVVSASMNGDVAIWNTKGGAQLAHVSMGYKAAQLPDARKKVRARNEIQVTCISVQMRKNNNEVIVVGMGSGAVAEWTPAGPIATQRNKIYSKVIRNEKQAALPTVNSRTLCGMKNGQVVSGHVDGRLFLWTGTKCEGVMGTVPSAASVAFLYQHPPTGRIVCFDSDGGMSLWDPKPATSTNPSPVFRSKWTNRVEGAVPLEDGSVMVYCPQFAQVWKPDDAKALKWSPVEPGLSVMCRGGLCPLTNGRVLTGADASHMLPVRFIKDGSIDMNITPEQGEDWPSYRGAIWGGTAWVSSETGGARLYVRSAMNGGLIATCGDDVDFSSRRVVTLLEAGPDHIISVLNSGHMRVWDIVRGEEPGGVNGTGSLLYDGVLPWERVPVHSGTWDPWHQRILLAYGTSYMAYDAK